MKALNHNLIALVDLLGDGDYHDGTSIGMRLDITRAAVWKLVKKLESYAVPISSAKGKGYRLEAPLILLDVKKIKSQLHDKLIQLEVAEKIESTNDYLKQQHKLNAILACLAEMQTAGKGRLNRQWHSPFADNIYLSLKYPFEKDISALSGLSLIVGLAVCASIEDQLNDQTFDVQLKWPNDVLINQKKVAGILIEIEAESHGACQVIIGIGMNVNMRKAFKKDIEQPWLSLCQLTHSYIDRNYLSAQVINTLVDYMMRFSNNGLSDFSKEWKKRDGLSGKNITVQCGKKRINGVAKGINAQGHLKLKQANGTVMAISSGDATLLK